MQGAQLQLHTPFKTALTTALSTARNTSRNLSSSRSATRVDYRNLRAKVKSMLPLDICCKYERRNNRLKKLQDFKQKQQSKVQVRGWVNTQQRPTQVFYENFKKVDPQHMFSKLKKAEIEQVSDYKHYFLGDKHVKDFESFINPKASIPSTPAIKTQRTYRNTHNNDRPITFRSKQLFTGKNWASTQLRIKDLRQEDSQLRDTKKLITDLKIQRALNNISLLNQTKQMRLELRKSQRKLKQSRILDFRKEQVQDQEIDNITCRLRTLCTSNKR